MVVVHMQVSDEDVVNARDRDSHGEDILDAAGPKSKKKRSPLPNSTMMQVVGRRVDISLQEEWGQRVPRTQIVAIGAAGSIDTSLLERTFISCISPTAASAS